MDGMDWVWLGLFAAFAGGMLVGVRAFIASAMRLREVMPEQRRQEAAWLKAYREESGAKVLARCGGDPAKIAAAVKERPWLRNIVGGK